MTTTAYEALAAKLVEVTAERDRARATAVALEQIIGRVADVHYPQFWRIGKTSATDQLVRGISDGDPYSTHTSCGHCREPWPCVTGVALDPEATS